MENIIKIIVLVSIIILTLCILNRKNIESFDKIPKPEKNSNFDLVSLQDFTKTAIRGKTGGLGLDKLLKDGKIWLGTWDSGRSGNNYFVEDIYKKKQKIGSVQLLLSGKHGVGSNKGSGDSKLQTINPDSNTLLQANNRVGNVASYKLRIEGYDNDGTWVYPIHCSDENGNIDFSVRNRLNISALNKNNRSLCTVGGDLFVNNDILVKSGNILSKSGNFKLNNGNITLNNGDISINTGNLEIKKGKLNISNDLTGGEMSLNNVVIRDIPKNNDNIPSDTTSKEKMVLSVLRHLVPRGTIIIYYNDNIPEGWEECNGSMSSNKYPPIFKKPDLQGRTVFGKKNSDGFSRIGLDKTSFGEGMVHTQLTIDNIPTHSHKINEGNKIDSKTVNTTNDGTHSHKVVGNTYSKNISHNHNTSVGYNDKSHTHNIENHKHNIPAHYTYHAGSHQHKYNDFYYSEHWGPHGRNYGQSAGSRTGYDNDNYYWQKYRNAEDMESTGNHRHTIPARTTDKSTSNTDNQSTNHRHSISIHNKSTNHKHPINLSTYQHSGHTHQITIPEIPAHNHGGKTGDTGLGKKFTNMPPYTVLIYIVKVF